MKQKNFIDKTLKATAFLALAVSAPAYASEIGTIDTALKGLLDIMTGTAAQSVATIAIAGTGWAWMSGNISMKTATILGLGIGIIFGAPEIAKALGAGGS